MIKDRFRETSSLAQYLLSCVLLIVVGCSEGPPLPDFAEKLVPVSGKLMLDGEPLAEATVIFNPDPQAPGGETAYGVTAADGTIDVKTPIPGISPREGVVEGKYIVTAFKLAMSDGSPVPKEMTDADAEAQGAKHVVPQRYLEPTTSPLKVEITPSAEPLVLELKSSGR